MLRLKILLIIASKLTTNNRSTLDKAERLPQCNFQQRNLYTTIYGSKNKNYKPGYMEYEEMQTGKVKWFNNAKGYGFILSDEGGEDMFAHYSSIQTEGYKTLKAGQSVEFDTKPSDQGTHAINIQPLDMLSPGQEQQASNAEKVLSPETQSA